MSKNTLAADVQNSALTKIPTIEDQIEIYQIICRKNNWHMLSALLSFQQNRLPTMKRIDFSKIGVPFIIARHRGLGNAYSCRTTINKYINVLNYLLYEQKIMLHISKSVSIDARAICMSESCSYNGNYGIDMKIANFSVEIKPAKDCSAIVECRNTWMTLSEFISIVVCSPSWVMSLYNNGAATIVLFGSKFIKEGVVYYPSAAYSPEDNALIISSFFPDEGRKYSVVAPYCLSI